MQRKTSLCILVLQLLCCFLLPSIGACQKSTKPAIVPEPLSWKGSKGQFALNAETQIWIPVGQSAWNTAALYLHGIVAPSTGWDLNRAFYKVENPPKAGNGIVFIPDTRIKTAEGYQLEITASQVSIRASSAVGAFYAVQTLRQLFPPEINAPELQKNIAWTAAACTIDDAPRFAYRGMHLDVGRHWFPVSFVKKYIDLMAAHKFNYFHWHLTEDQGWRIEIKKYPLLQSVAACREQTLVGHYSDSPERYDGVPYCHYYTQEEVKEIVKYARERFITIIPEIEMPGHALAALSAYPELGCTGGPYEAGTKWGVYDEVFCAGSDKTFAFIEGVLEEVTTLFPGQYVHVGGDECPKDRWKTCSRCQRRMQTEGLKDEHELQSYVIRRAADFLEKKGKKLIGWDEILEGGLAPSATVMSWRGTDGGIAAARAGHDAIMTPGSHCYFDHYQSDPATEPIAISGYTTLEKTYSYEPIPEGLKPAEAQHILGAQGNLWTEYIKYTDYAEYMAYPRACALAEVVWSAKEKRNWPDFKQRIQVHFKRLDALKVNYAKSIYDIQASFEQGKVRLESDPSVQIRYTTDGVEPQANSSLYDAAFPLSKSSVVKAAAFRGQTRISKTLTVNYAVHKASGKPYTLSKNPKQYTGGETYALTNGVSGGIKTWSAWVGLVNHNIDPVIDLGQVLDINRVSTHYVNSPIAWIHPPKRIEIFVSDDGKTFRSIGKQQIDAASKLNSGVETVSFSALRAKARYLKLVATTTGVIPQGYPGAGEGAWMFLDEVIVE